jgi:CDP-diacylglycerol--glycerol-3-phosphate 3-phosphatidyltransferase
VSPNSFTTLPNLLSLSRVPLGIAVFACVAHDLWPAALAIFVLATLTDWLDGWTARRFKLESPVGRSLDPLTDKFLICGTFIYLQSANVGVLPWMVTVVVGREILITGIRGIVEASGKKFGADWFGKLKTVLQCAAILAILSMRTFSLDSPVVSNAGLVVLYAMLLATTGSGIQYLVKATRLLRD